MASPGRKRPEGFGEFLPDPCQTSRRLRSPLPPEGRRSKAKNEKNIPGVLATVQVPFLRGGAEILAEGLQRALQAEGHDVDIVSVPFKWYPPVRILDHMLACRLLDITESAGTQVDRVIGLKFPAYLIPHPNKVLWILHQFRQAYDLGDAGQGLGAAGRDGDIRAAIHKADETCFAGAHAIHVNSPTTQSRLMRYNGV